MLVDDHPVMRAGLANLLTKLGVSGRTPADARALDLGLLATNPPDGTVSG